MSDYQKLNKRRGQALTISDVGTIETQYDAAKREAEAGRWNISAGSVAYSSLSGKPTLGDAASKNVGVGTGDVAAGNHTHSYSSLSEKPTLGSAAAKNVGTGSQDVSAGDHSHAGYVTANNAITGATKAKVTFDAKGLVTGGADLIASDIPTIDYSALSGKPTLGAAAAKDVGTGATNVSAGDHNHTGTYAPDAKGVTNGDSHDHNGGDGAQIDHVNLANNGTYTHAQIDTHIGIPNPNDISATRRTGTTRERWYTMPLASTAQGTSGALTSGRIYAIPFFVPKTITIDRIAINCTTLVAAGKVRLGIYNDSNGEPGSKLLDAGEADTSGTGVKALTISQQLVGGNLYWLVALSNSATHVFRAPALAAVLNVLGNDNTLGTANILGFYAAQTYGALPDNFPAPTNMTTVIFPLIFVRLSA